MTTFLFVQGLDPIELAPEETFNKAKSRGNQALTRTNHDGSQDKGNKPMDKLTFKTVDEDSPTGIGRVTINPEKFIGVGSDTAKDEKIEDEGDE